ncbi:MAG TPA: L,D-transpeptidase/peptidoglycan binding protein [Solirubrobacteraceae bacterium]|nr:L,D-transpeptidase/peptidoglycan binding protein [Solirubrobacteraceae bacterium]
MRKRPLAIGAALAAVLLLGLGALYVWDSSRDDVIAKGVHVGGVDIGGLQAQAARNKLQRQLLVSLNRPVIARYHQRSFTLTPAQAHVTVNVSAAVDEALKRSRKGSIFTRVGRTVFGDSLNIRLKPVVSYSKRAVKQLVRHIDKTISRSPRDATVQPSARTLRKVRGRDGIVVERRPLRGAIRRLLTNAGGNRTITVLTRRVAPKVTTAQLARKFASYIVIRRQAFELRYYRHLKLAHTYPIAVGRQGLETPAGLYSIQGKEVNPSWHVPNSSWAGKLAGTTIPPGPKDPIKARWMGFNGGAGIHGTEDVGSLGSAASHGCIRMSIPDVITLYKHVSVGTPVYVA